MRSLYSWFSNSPIFSTNKDIFLWTPYHCTSPQLVLSIKPTLSLNHLFKTINFTKIKSLFWIFTCKHTRHVESDTMLHAECEKCERIFQMVKSNNKIAVSRKLKGLKETLKKLLERLIKWIISKLLCFIEIAYNNSSVASAATKDKNHVH